MPVTHIGNFPAGKAEMKPIQVKNNEANLDNQNCWIDEEVPTAVSTSPKQQLSDKLFWTATLNQHGVSIKWCPAGCIRAENTSKRLN